MASVTSLVRKSIMTGTTFKRSPTAGVGGPSYYNYFEEAGTFPKLDKTYLYMRPALESGAITTGFFIAAGSVGELKDCKPLKKFMESPEEYGFLGVENTWVNKDRVSKITGLYLPEQWGMPPFIDEFGNSKVQEALEYINKDYDTKEKEMDAEDYQLHISQHPRYMEEAFAYREVSKWPIRRIDSISRGAQYRQLVFDLALAKMDNAKKESLLVNTQFVRDSLRSVGYSLHHILSNSGKKTKEEYNDWLKNFKPYVKPTRPVNTNIQ